MEQGKSRLDIDEDPRFSRGEAKVQRAGWAVMALVVGAGLLGFFANGPVSHSTARSGDLTVSYQRFGRNQGRTTVAVDAPATAATDGRVEIWVSQRFLESYELEEVRPEPESTSTRAGGVVFAFAVEGTDTNVKATFTLRPEETGRRHGAVAVGQSRPVAFSQFVYP